MILDVQVILNKLLSRKSCTSVLLEQLYEAERESIEHEAAAEHHAALANMYSERVVRIRERLGYDKDTKQDGAITLVRKEAA